MAKREADRGRARLHARLLLLGAVTASVVLSLALNFDWLRSARIGLGGGTPVAGDIAERDVRSPADLTIVDREATERERQAAIEAAPVVYDYEPGWGVALRARLHAAFMAAQAARARDPNLGGPSPAAAFLGEIGEDAKRSETALAPLLDKEDLAPLEEAISLALRPLLDRKIVAESSSMPRQDARQRVLIRELGSAREEAASEVASQLLTLSDALGMYEANLAEVLPGAPPARRQMLVELGRLLVRPNLSFNLAATDERRQAAAQSVADAVISLRKGEIIVRRWDRLTDRHVKILSGIQEQEAQHSPLAAFFGAAGLICVFLVVSWRFAAREVARFAAEPKDAAFLLVSLVATALGVKAGLFFCEVLAQYSEFSGVLQDQSQLLHFGIPIASAAMLVRLVHSAETAALFSLVVAVVAALQVGGGIGFACYAAVGSLVGAFGARRVTQRGTLLRAGLRVGLVNAAVIPALLLIRGEVDVVPALLAMLAGFLSGCISGGLVTAVAPLAESIFHYTTDIKLLEVANREQPLLRELEMRAPGTYHHSMMVGHLAEKAADAIGANALLAKVAGYYHDIGKMRRPHFFVENITVHQGENRHEKLAPSMSARIIQAHVKDGLEMGVKHQLARPILQGIGEHHGTSIIRFFYEKAKEQATQSKGDSIQEHDYRYGGPKPQTREAGILMLADSVEAASRTLADASPSRIQQLVQRIINNYFRDGQLDECNLTLRDLHLIARSFMDTLFAIRHERIDYPEATDAEGRRLADTADDGVVERIEPRSKDRSERAPEKDEGDLKRLGLP